MSKKGLFILAALILVVVIVVSVFLFLPREKALKPSVVAPEAEVVVLREENTTLYSLLYQMGLDPLVDVTDQRVLIRYNQPEEISEKIYYRILAYSARTSPNSEEIIVQIYRNYSPHMEIRANTQDVLSWIEGRISMEEPSKRTIRREIQ